MSAATTHSLRRGGRVCLSAEVSLRRLGRTTYRVRVTNLSHHGCKAEFVDRPQLDEPVWIKFDRLESLPAMVCWVRGLEVGVEFDRPIHSAVFDMLLQRLKN